MLADASPLVVDVQLRSSLAGLRALGRAGTEPIALAPTRTAAGMWSRHARRRALAPDPASHRAAFAAALARLADVHGPVVAYPGREEAVDAVLDAARLSSNVLLPFPARALPTLRSKPGLEQLAIDSGLNAPPTLEQATADGLAGADLDFPFALKPVRQPGPIGTTQIVRSREELRELLHGVPGHERLMVQPWIEGLLVSLGLVISREGEIVARFQHVADRTWPPEAGSTARAVSVRPDDVLVARAARALVVAGYWGLVEMEFLAGPGGPMLIDVNPRYYGCLALPLACGVNLPAAWHAVVLDRGLPSPAPYRLGVTYRWLMADVLAATRGAPDRLLERAPRPRAGAMWAADDPLPGPLVARAELTARLARRLRLARPAPADRGALANGGEPVAPAANGRALGPREASGEANGAGPELAESRAPRAAVGGQPIACVLGDMDLIRPLGRAGIPCAAVARADDPTRFSRFTCARIARHDAWSEQESQVEALLRFGRAQPVPPVLFYEGDSELLLVSRNREVLAEVFRFVVADADLVEALLDKARFAALAERLALPVPRARLLRPAVDEGPKLDLTFPILVKPLTRHQERWEPVGGYAKAVEVETAEALRALWPRLAAAGIEAVAQELIRGPETRIESHHAYVDEHGEIAGEFTGRKIRTHPTRYGHSTALELTDAPDVRALGREVLAKLQLRGLAKADFKRAEDGRLHLLEVNPRPTLWHHLGALGGVNLPAAVYADLAGLPRPPLGPARAGVRWCLPWQDLAAARESGVPLARWAWWTLRCEAKSVVAWDDPMPFLRGRLAPRVTRQIRARLAPSSSIA